MAMPRKPKHRGGASHYRFKIDAWTPTTMPMSRLAEYMAELATLLGERNAVHFSRITKGSAALNWFVDREAAPKVRDRVVTVRSGDVSGEPRRAFQNINKMLRDDNAVGVLRESVARGVVVKFPGREEAQEKFGSIKQQGSLDGIVTGIRGKDETIHITIQSEGEQISGAYTNKMIAKQLGAKLFEPVRLFGQGRWSRDSEGVWTLIGFKIESFEALQDIPLTAALAELRKIPTEWSDDAYKEIDELRHGPKGKKNGGH